MLQKLGPIWLYSFTIVTALFAISLGVFGFDIPVQQEINFASHRPLTHLIDNDPLSYRYYKIDERFAFLVALDPRPGEMTVGILPYTENIPPLCFFCGRYTDDYTDRRLIKNPVRAGDVFLETTPRERDGALLYSSLNRTTGAFAELESIARFGSVAELKRRRVKPEDVAGAYPELSFAGPDDEDCFIAFSGLTICYAILLLWGLVRWTFARK